MTVRTAYPNVFAEAAESFGILGFQRCVEVNLDGKRFNDASVAALVELSQLEKLVITRASICEAEFAHFRQVRPDVQVVQSVYGMTR